MTDKPRPPLGLHERITDVPIRLESIPGLGTCPACRRLIELFLVQDGSLESPRCPHCAATLRLIVPRQTK